MIFGKDRDCSRVLDRCCGALVVTIYGVLAVLTVKPDKPSLTDGLNGGWLVSVVASQAVAMLTVLISAAGILAGLERPLPIRRSA